MAFINNRDYASKGLMHPNMANHPSMKAHGTLHGKGHEVDFYGTGNGDKKSGYIVKNDGKEVHGREYLDGRINKTRLHKFKVSEHLPEGINEMQETLTESELEYIVENMTISEFMQLDELSKETLGRYVKGAGRDLTKIEKEYKELGDAGRSLDDVTYSRHLKKVDPDASKGVRDRADATRSALHKAQLKADDKSWNRKEGIGLAIKKLIK